MATYEELLDDSETGEPTAPPATDASQEQGSRDSPEVLPTAEKTVPLRALEDERSKRQNFESQVQAQQRQIDVLIQSLQAQGKTEPAPSGQSMPDLLLDPDKWQINLLQKLDGLLQNQLFTTKLTLSEDLMRETKPDYDEMIDAFVKPAMERDPTFRQQVITAANPAKFAYQQAKRLKAEKELGDDFDADKLKATLREQVKAELMAELQEKQGELQEKAKIPVSLGRIGSSAPNSSDKIPEGGIWRARDLY